MILAVNKMDLVGYQEAVFDAIAEEFTAYAVGLGIAEITAIPISALVGDNVVEPSTSMAWYGGPTVLEHLESVPVSDDLTGCPARFPVQYVIRLDCGVPRLPRLRRPIAVGTFRTGDAVTVLPSGHTTQVAGIDLLGKAVDAAWSSQSVTLLLADDIDVSRGDLIVPTVDEPALAQDIEATVCHVADTPLTVGQRVLLKHATRTVKAVVKDIPSRLALDDLSDHPDPACSTVNDIGRVRVRTAEPLPIDAYADSRPTGSFLLVDPADGTTLTAGMAGDSFAVAVRRTPVPTGGTSSRRSRSS